VAIKADALLFDLDGTLVDSMDSVERCWLQWAREFDADTGQLMNIFRGHTAEYIVATLLPGSQVSAGLARIVELELADVATTSPTPGAAQLLTSLPPSRWAIVTSGVISLAAARINAAGLPMPAVVITSEDVTHGKPDPEPYLLAAGKLHVDVSRCVVIEDTPTGVASARGAGMAVIGVTNTDSDGDLDADALVDSLAQLRVGGTNPMVVTSSSW
jgi:sugar-phosphatase